MLRLAARVPEYVLGTLVLLLTALVNAEVALRYVLGLPVAEVDEIARVLFVWLAFLGAALGVAKGAHISIDLLGRRLSPAADSLMRRLAALLVTGFGAYLVVDGIRFERQVAHSVLTITGWSVGAQFAVVPISGALIVLYGLQGLVAGRPDPGGTGHGS
ncbi:MAG: hypothetical protein A2X52_16075 [Candidatus Rokubacteria bacterium GWC2_70_16]|nr:MAG: hypothetical protein A2X52_16075 [Candidatus Rokubacteria bacterium GWC2_70_16]